MDIVLIDSDVILDFFLDREPFSDKALFKVIVHDENGNAVKDYFQSNLFEVIESNCQDI